MSINPVVARIDVMVNGQAAMDRLATSYLAMEGMAQRATRAVRGWNSTQSLMGQTATGLFGLFGRLTTQIASHNNAMDRAGRATSSFHGNILRLTQSMILFSVLLPLVRLPQTAIQSFQEFVNVGVAWEHQARSVNSLIGLQGAAFDQLDNSLRNIADQYGLTSEQLGVAAKQIMSTLGVVQRNTAGMDAATRAQDDYVTGMKLTADIAQLSTAAFGEMTDVTQSAFTILSTGKFTVDQASVAFDTLARTVQTGRVTWDQYNQAAQKFMPMAAQWISVGKDATDQLNRLNSAQAMFAASSMQIGPQRAATGMARYWQAITGANAQTQKLIAQAEAVRKQGRLGTEYSLDPQRLLGMSNTADIQGQITRVMGPYGSMTNQWIAQQKKMGRVVDENADRVAHSDDLYKQYFQNITAIRVAQTATSQAIEDSTRTMASAAGLTGATAQARLDPQLAAQRLKSSWESIQIAVFRSIQNDFRDINNNVADFFDMIQKNIASGAGGAGFLDRIKYVADQIVQAFTNYYYTGGGQAQIHDLGYTFGSNLAKFLKDFFTGSGKGAIWDAAGSFTSQFVKGIQDQLPDLLGAAIQSSIVKVIATYALLKTAGASGPLAALGTGITMSTIGGGGQGGFGGNILGLSVLALGATAAAKSLYGREWGGTIGAGGVRSGGTSLSNIFSGWGASAARRVATAGYTGADYISGAEIRANRASGVPMRGMGIPAAVATNEMFELQPATGKYISRGVFANMAERRLLMQAAGGAAPAAGATAPGIMSNIFGRGGAIGRLPGLGRMRLGGTLLTAGVLGGLGLVQAMQENNDRDKWTSGAGAVGSVLGSVGLGALGALIPGLGPIGMIAGGMAGGVGGQWLGEKVGGGIYDLLNPKAAAVNAGTGMGPGTEEAQNLATVFMMGINASDLPGYLQQINRKLDSPTRFGVTATSAAATTRTPGTGAGPGLVASESNQFYKDPTAPLSDAQAQAACGPAAVDFFTRAYGRTPNLREAYDLVTQFQGHEPTTGGGSSITAMGQAMTKFGAPNEVYQGSNIDWGRLANNAKAGIPGVINIGPGGKGFPGHFFQVSDWDPNTNRFRVGISGTNVSRWGGKEWMTPEEMMAIGPSFGAIYGTQAPTAAATTTPASAGGDIMSRNAAAAMDIQKKTGIPASYLLAVAYNENGPAGSQLSNLYNNFGGIKAAGAKNLPGYAGSVNLPTTEVINGRTVATTADFAKFADPASGLAASANFLLTNPRYAAAVAYARQGGDPAIFAQMVAGAGYATDPNWASKIATLEKQAGQYLGTGTGPGDNGGAIQLNGPLIGTVMLSGSATQEDANQLAAMIANALEDVASSGSGIIGQAGLIQT